ncbi:MAG: hypothetical protein IPJ69_15140 [Deltaproteobacteria bacterium]|nr:MAG: hypothetical protein IPJ69_15140 [Deltaproteobacteria bacterium]
MLELIADTPLSVAMINLHRILMVVFCQVQGNSRTHPVRIVGLSDSSQCSKVSEK